MAAKEAGHLKELRGSPKFINLKGMKIGLLTMLHCEGSWHHGGTLWLAQCDCGNLTHVRSIYATSGHTTSCGCHRDKKLKESNVIHGMSRSVEHSIWRKIIQRCCNKNDKGYKVYGGRGIKVCERWLSSFQNFYNDLGPRPSSKHSIDRINNNGPYSPENCKWSTLIEQACNKSTNRFLMIGGVRFTVSQAARTYNLSPGMVAQRLRLKWDDRSAIFKPKKILRNERSI